MVALSSLDLASIQDQLRAAIDLASKNGQERQASLAAELRRAIDLAATADHRHIPGTPFEWQHGYIPRYRYLAEKYRKKWDPDKLVRPEKSKRTQAAAMNNGLHRYMTVPARPRDKMSVNRHVDDVKKISRAFSAVLAKHFRERQDAGIHVLEGTLPDTPLFGRFTPGDVTHDNRSWATVGGAYVMNRRVALIGNQRHGSSSVALHETGHALDDAMGSPGTPASRMRDFRLVHAKVLKLAQVTIKPTNYLGGPSIPQSVSTIAPYYREKRAEMWAEAFATWTKNRDLPEDKRRRAIADALSPMGFMTVGGTTIDAQVAEYTQLLDDYFIRQDRRANHLT